MTTHMWTCSMHACKMLKKKKIKKHMEMYYDMFTLINK